MKNKTNRIKIVLLIFRKEDKLSQSYEPQRNQLTLKFEK